jgi:glutaredoxin
MEEGLYFAVFIMAKVVMYSTPGCGGSRAAREFLTYKGIQFEEKNINDPDVAEEVSRKTGGAVGTPVILIGNRVILGFQRASIQKALGTR